MDVVDPALELGVGVLLKSVGTIASQMVESREHARHRLT
jgi:hypothetical protein